jgi:ATP-binding cassette, subfamily G (WHITE), eye pigment precursor transporter
VLKNCTGYAFPG